MVRVKSSLPQKKRRSTMQVAPWGTKTFKIYRSVFKSIRRLQNSTKSCIRKLPFSRLIREILQDCVPNFRQFRVQAKTLEALQEAAEMYLIQLFEDSDLCAAHAKRITIKPNDMKLVLALRGSLIR